MDVKHSNVKYESEDDILASGAAAAALKEFLRDEAILGRVKMVSDSKDWDVKGSPGVVGGSNPVYHFAARWTLPRDTALATPVYDKCHALFTEWLAATADHWIFQCEATGSAGVVVQNVHFQCYFHTKLKTRAKQLFLSLYTHCRQEGQNEAQFYLEPASKVGQEALKAYAMKTETRISGPWSDKPIYMGQDLPTDLYEWQKSLVRELKGKPNNRKIVWIVDTEGAAGKTTFAKYMMFHLKAPVIRYAKIADMLYEVKNKKNAGVYIFDLSRSRPAEFKFDDLYAALESIKDGLITSTKYQSETWGQMPAHVLVLSNHEPIKSAISQDRWDIRYLDNGLLCSDPQK